MSIRLLETSWHLIKGCRYSKFIIYFEKYGSYYGLYGNNRICRSRVARIWQTWSERTRQTTRDLAVMEIGLGSGKCSQSFRVGIGPTGRVLRDGENVALLWAKWYYFYIFLTQPACVTYCETGHLTV